MLLCCCSPLIFMSLVAPPDEDEGGRGPGMGIAAGFLIVIACALNGYFTSFAGILVETEPSYEGYSCYVTVVGEKTRDGLLWLGTLLLFAIFNTFDTGGVSLVCMAPCVSFILWGFNFNIALKLFEEYDETLPLVSSYLQIILPIFACCCYGCMQVGFADSL